MGKVFNNSNKVKLILILLGISLFVFAFLPTFGRYKNRTSFYELVEWDGSVASGYRSGSGSEFDPYVISNGSEFAFFAAQLEHTDYSGIYFELSNDIVLNKGLFDYDGTISYSIDDSVYQLDEFTNKYNGGKVNLFNSIKKFNGHLNGNFYRIYGLYITDEDSEDLALFGSIGGSIKDLYISNSLVYGGYNTAMLAVDSSDAEISNVMIDGFVVGNQNDFNKKFYIENITSGNSIDLSAYSSTGDFISSSIKGTFESTEDNKLTINGTEFSVGEFEVELGDTKLDSISYSVLNESYTLSNLEYTIVSENGVSSSFVVNAHNTKFTNIVNKAYVYSNKVSSAFVHSSTGPLKITNGYNNGNIESKGKSYGLVSYINAGEGNFTNVYNTDTSDALLIGKVNNCNVNIKNSFVTNEGYLIDEISSSSVNVTDSYALNENVVRSGNLTGGFYVKTIDEFKGSSLGYSEFVSFVDMQTNSDNVWVNENGGYPILFIDDLNRPAASINVSVYSWNTLAHDLDDHKFASDFTFSISTTDVLADVESIEYYLHKGTNALSLEEINNIDGWKKYNDIVTINEEGSYIIYAKITADNKDTYINSDLLIINPENTIANATLGDYKWSSVVDVPKYIYLDESDKVLINVNEEFVNVDNVSYYITSDILKENELEALSEVWMSYDDGVTINSNNNNIVYFKIIDNNGYTSYISTDYLTLDGYTMKDIVVGRNIASNDGVNITNKSRISFEYSYVDSNLFIEGYNHNIVSNIMLPEKTHITLIDNINNKVYKYKTDSSSYGYDDVNKRAVYSLNKFNEIGTLETLLLNESSYVGTINEDFKIIIDFKDTTFDKDYENVNILFEVTDSEGKKVIPTLKNSVKSFNIYSGNSSLKINSDFNGFIDYNKDNSNSINFDISLVQPKVDEETVYDSTYQDKKYGLEIRMIDNDTAAIMGKNYLSNIQFKYDDKVYTPYSNGIVNINLDNKTSGNLVIDTYINNSKITGNYSFYVCAYNSYDGINYNLVNLTECINVPLNIVDNYKVDYNFEISIKGEDRIFIKDQDKTLNFEMLYQSEIENPNIRVSLYEKNELTAYDQSYSLVDLGDYIYDELSLIDNKTYKLTEEIVSSSEYENYSLSFKNSMFRLNGYKLVFDLYDGDIKVGTIEKKFIVKGER